MNGTGAFLGLMGTAIGSNIQNNRQDRQNQFQEKLMGIQYGNQKKLNEHGHQLQYEMWKKTNYPAQMEMLKEAGLNPSLLYGQGGGGGTTTGSQGGGSAQGGQANAPMDIGNAIQMGMMASNIKLTNATAKKTEEEAIAQEMKNKNQKLFGNDADTSEMQNRISKAKAEGKMLYNQWANLSGGETWDNTPDAKNRAEVLLLDDATVKHVESNLAREENKYIEEKVKYNLMNAKFEAELKKANAKLTREQERKLWHDIWQGWTKAGLQGLDSIMKGYIGKALSNKK